MTTASEERAEQSLRLHLPGSWAHFHGDTPEQLRAQAHHYVRTKVGVRDQDAQSRAEVRRQLLTVIEAAWTNSASAMFVCDSLAPNVPMHALITVFVPSASEHNPAPQASAPADPFEAFREALVSSQGKGRPEAVVEVPAAGGRALRVVTLDEEPTAQGAPPLRHVRADYWVEMPGRGRMVLVSCFTPLGDIPYAVVRLFDAIVDRSVVVPAHS